MVADKPTVSTDLINRAIKEFRKEKPGILYIKTPKGRGHPIIFSEKLFRQIMSLVGNKATEDFIKKHQNEVVELEDGTIQPNINTWEDYKKLCR
jgi:CTP:molybdopterin cytidylyltransferase MocA